MTCVSPATVTIDYPLSASVATVCLRHCDAAGFMYLSATFTPRNIGAQVTVQGLIHVEGEQGPKTATTKVTFHDDGMVTGYGDTSNGVRFPQKRFHMNRSHAAILSVFSGRS